MDKLVAWKKTSCGASALLIEGARRVGKTTIVKEFARLNYKSYIIIDFSEKRKEVNELFWDIHDLDLFYAKLSALYDVTLVRRHSLIVFDEVQAFQRARECIKFFVQDGRYDFIETGSLLSINYNAESDIVLPSEEDSVTMYPMDFEEFLLATHNNGEETYALLKESFEKLRPLGSAVHRHIMDDFRKYMLVGGMPQAVSAYVENDVNKFERAEAVKQNIIKIYRNDVIKFGGSRYEKAKIRSIFDAIPAQLSQEDKKFVLADIDPHARSRRYESAFGWLDDAMIVNSCIKCSEPGVGLKADFNSSARKCYMGDTGLLVSLQFSVNKEIGEDLYHAILLDRLGINEGMMMENITAQMLTASGHNLYFYKHYDEATKKPDMEVDFLILRGRKVCPIEVKSSEAAVHKSFDRFREKYHQYLGQGYVLHSGDLAVKDNTVYLPLYMTMFL